MKLDSKLFKEAVSFGSQLLTTGDLDPIYITIANTKMTATQRARLLVAYWCLYHLGAAAHIAEASGSDANYWKRLMVAAVNKDRTWPHGSERRHWRGLAAIESVNDLHHRWASAAQWVDYIAEATNFGWMSERVQEQRGFGPWIAFKVCDMMERVLHKPVSFANCDLGFYSEPSKGAALLLGQTRLASPAEIKYVTDKLLEKLGDSTAPPDYERPVNIQEAETILCKFKSMKKGHYHVGKDIAEVRHGLAGWGRLADGLAANAPELVNRA